MGSTMARTKPRRTSGRRRGASDSIPDILTVWRFLIRPQMLGTLLVVLAAAAVPSLLPLATVLNEARDALVGAVGLHVFTLTLAIASLGGLLAFRRGSWLRRHRRHLLGAGVLLVFSAGLLGYWHPEATVGTVDLATTSAGGDAGRLLVSGALATVAWAATLPLAFALLWPRSASTLVRGAPVAVVAVALEFWRLGLHRSAARGVRALVHRFRHRFRRSAPESQAATVPAMDIERASAMPEAGLAETGAAETGAAETGVTETEGIGTGVEESLQRDPTQMPMDMESSAGEWRHSEDGWQLPPISVLKEGTPSEGAAVDNARRAKIIEDTLASFGVDTRVTQINEGPAVTQFGVEPGWDVRTKTVTERDASGRAVLDEHGAPKLKQIELSRTRIRVSRITTLQNDLALALATPALRIEAPVPGKPMVGIEVPNVNTTVVTLRGVIESAAFRKLAQRAALPIALGVGVSGEAVVADLAAMPHLLIAGATGSGKSVCLNAIITCLLTNASPDQLRLVLIDPKRVELTVFAAVPHLAFSEIVVDMDRIVGTLQAVINEMESRYRRFAQAGVRDIRRYNEQATSRRIPYWVVVIDELADLMLSAPYQVEQQIVRLAQLARATGIHLVIATQRPSVDVVTGLIKANFPTRIAFAVASQVDARTVLDQGGAEKLLGRGDMLYLPTDAQKPKRLQGVFVSDEETEAVVRFWTSGRFTSLAPAKHDNLLHDAEQQVEQAGMRGAEEDDPMFQRALELAGELRTLSTSMLQRRLRIGYPRAARIMDELEERGVVGPAEAGGSSREVLVGAAQESEPALPSADAPPDSVAENDESS